MGYKRPCGGRERREREERRREGKRGEKEGEREDT